MFMCFVLFVFFSLPKKSQKTSIRRPHSTNQKVVRGKCPLHCVLFFFMGSLARKLFSRTRLSWPILCHSGRILHSKVLEHLVWSNTCQVPTLGASCLGITAACYRTAKAQIPRSAAGSAGKSARKKGSAGGTAESGAESSRFLWKSRETALLPAVHPALPFFPALFPALPAALLGIWAFSVL